MSENVPSASRDCERGNVARVMSPFQLNWQTEKNSAGNAFANCSDVISMTMRPMTSSLATCGGTRPVGRYTRIRYGASSDYRTQG